MKKKPINIEIDPVWVEGQIREEREAKARYDEVMKDVPDDPEVVFQALISNLGKIFKDKP